MKIVVYFASSCTALGCNALSNPPRPSYRAETFRADAAALVSSDRYVDAARFVEAADVERQVEYDGGGCLGVYGLGLYAPDVSEAGGIDWTFPGTSDARINDTEDRWNRAATAFAERYNRRRLAGRQSYSFSEVCS